MIAALHGDADASQGYCDRLQTIRMAYQRHRAEAYASERRWPESPFWVRRQTGTF